MNKKYLSGIILEQIARAEYLIKIIPQVKKKCVLTLKKKCIEQIQDYLQILEILVIELENRDEEDYRDIYRTLRIIILQIQIIEYFGVSALYYQDDELDFLNDLLPKIYEEINLNLDSPAIACISTTYFSYSPITNVIFIPIGETGFILHLVDLFHEIGHDIINEIGNDEIKNISEAYNQAIDIVNEHYANLLLQKKRENGPKKILSIIWTIYSRWKDWIAEFFCDLFACCILGPSYVWCHYHISSKISQNIYSLHERHPSDDARMKILIACLKVLKFEKAADELKTFWLKMPLSINDEPQFESIYAYNEELFEKLIKVFLDGFKKDNIMVINPKNLENLVDNSIVKLLNDSWQLFIKNPATFRIWEKDAIKNIKEL